MGADAMNKDSQPDLRLVAQGGDGSPADRSSDAATDLVADLVGDTGMLPPDKIERLRERAVRGGSVSQALLDGVLAAAIGIARSLAERDHLRLVDLAVEGVDSNATS